MELFTKQQIAEITIRPLSAKPKIQEHLIKVMMGMTNKKFLMTVRHSTKLHVCNFGNGRYYINYLN